MSKRSKMAALLLAADLVSFSASAQDETIIADVRCVVVGMKLSSGTSTEQSEGIVLSWYFIGRLDGREPKLDIKRLLSDELARMSGAVISSEERRCKRILDERGQEVTRMGEEVARSQQ